MDFANRHQKHMTARRCASANERPAYARSLVTGGGRVWMGVEATEPPAYEALCPSAGICCWSLIGGGCARKALMEAMNY